MTLAWTPDMITRLRRLAPTHNGPEIARRLAVSYYAVKWKAALLGIPINGGRPGPRPGFVLSGEHKARISAAKKAAFRIRPYERHVVRP